MRTRLSVIEALRHGGVMAAEEEADELLAAAPDGPGLDAMVERRLTGEPTAWITGRAGFLGHTLHIEPGVYVPRWKTEAVALHALEHLPEHGTAIDLCTGSGALATTLRAGRPTARVVATDIDQAAVRCAQVNGVEAYHGDLFAPLPHAVTKADVIAAVPPYVPAAMIGLLPRDVVAFEPIAALDGGADGLAIAGRIVTTALDWLSPGGALVIEVGVDQTEALSALMEQAGLVVHQVLLDGDGDPCGACATSPPT